MRGRSWWARFILGFVVGFLVVMLLAGLVELMGVARALVVMGSLGVVIAGLAWLTR